MAIETIEECTDCGHCREHCPYGLDTPELLRANLKDYREFHEMHGVDQAVHGKERPARALLVC